MHSSIRNDLLLHFCQRKKKAGSIPALRLQVERALILSITSRILSSGCVYEAACWHYVCCLLKQCYPTASAESVSAVLMLCQRETPGHGLLHQPFLLFNRTMNMLLDASKNKTGKE